jgi:hypothetical protein
MILHQYFSVSIENGRVESSPPSQSSRGTFPFSGVVKDIPISTRCKKLGAMLNSHNFVLTNDGMKKASKRDRKIPPGGFKLEPSGDPPS